MGRKKKKEEEESEERWLITYADMITLLVAFFMMMYSMSVVNLEKFKKAAIGIRSGFNGSIPDGKPHKAGDSLIETGAPSAFIPKPVIAIVPGKGADKPEKEMTKSKKSKAAAATGDKKGSGAKAGKGAGKGSGSGAPKLTAAQMRAKRVGALTDKINRQLEPVAGKGSKAAQVVSEKKGVAIELMGDMIFFPSDSAKLNEEAKAILDAVVGVLEKVPNEISVEGHTSKYETWENSPFSNSWELSTARAMAVVTYFMNSQKIKPNRISVTGYGQYRPLDKNGQGKQAQPTAVPVKNDRVRVFIYQD